MSQPIVYDLFCGLGGFTEGFLAEGFKAIGFDIEAHDYGNGGYPGELVLRDIRSLTGAELVQTHGVPAVIVASPPCQEFSYMAMPWSRAKDIRNALLGKGEFPEGYKGSRTFAQLTDLFNQCFRIQREVSEAAGHYVPIIIENVRGAQEWVGKARWNFGSFYLWGDVPALMPIPAKAKLKTIGPVTASQAANHNCHINEMRDAGKKQPGRNFHFPEKYGIPSPSFNGHGEEPSILRAEGVKAGDRNKGAKNGEHKWSHSFADTLKGEGNKTAGMNWSDQTKRGQDFTRIAGQQADTFGWRKSTELRRNSSKSKARKQVSAEIAKIPPALASWIARCFKSKETC